MASYGFCFRASLRRDGGAGSLYLRIIHGGESRSITTPYRVFPEEWDPVRRRLLIPYTRNERSLRLTDYENSMACDVRRLEDLISRMDKEGEYSVDELMGRYRSMMSGNSFYEYAGHLAEEMEHGGHVRTAQAYRTAAVRLRGFNGGQDIGPEHITASLVADFQQSLKAEGVCMNTISFYMRTLRAIYHKAIAEGRIARRIENPFAGVYTGVSPTRKLALSSEQLTQLAEFDPTGMGSTKRFPFHLSQALAMFLFCYHARGMSFVDMANLRKSDLRGDIIRYRRRKTGQAIEVKMQPAMRRIIDWFATQTVGCEYLFPVIADPDKDPRLQYESGLRLQNMRLKKIASLVGFGKRFSSHAARHSWATMAKNTGLPLAVISEGLGHTNQKTTEIYLASLERSILDQATKMVSEAIVSGTGTKTVRNRPGNDLGDISRFLTYGSRYGAPW